MRFLILALAAFTACGDEPPLSDAKWLVCPTPGALPFRLESHGFQQETSKSIAANGPRSKDHSSDTIGNPDGLSASIYLAANQSPTATPIGYRGAKARTTHTGGLFSNPLSGEHVSLWSYDTSTEAWLALGRGDTDDNGFYDLPDTGFVAPNGQPI